ncbi:MAG: NUDIX hydrolase [Candidatus Buchananbacteria bacterium]
MLYQIKPMNFNPAFEVIGNFVQCNGEIILLHRQNHKAEGDTWGTPSGKIDKGESMFDAVYRETAEETGLVIPPKNIKFFSTVYVSYSDYDFVYHIFYTQLNKKVEIKINESEHKDAKWILPKEALNLPLIEDLDSCIKLFFKI